MKILVVSSYPPRHCGIGTYAHGQVAHLRALGHVVTVLSPPDGDGQIRSPFLGGRAFLRAGVIGGGFDRIVVHFQPALYYRPRRPVSKVMTSLGLLALSVARGPRLEVILHEADEPRRWRPDFVLLKLALARAGRISFHTRAEWEALERAYRVSVRGAIITHQVEVSSELSRQEARADLNLGDVRGPVFVCAGFLQPSKGYERAVDAFEAARTNGARLYIVGSVRERTPENASYAQGLARRAGEVPGVRFVDRFLSDDEFDRWVAAADWVVLPYRRSWSSGVLARAQALGTPAIVAAVGGLPEQAGGRDLVFHDDEGLRAALVRAAASGDGGRP
jgi:glycosyltransferase involved in cell wall biosynthesis